MFITNDILERNWYTAKQVAVIEGLTKVKQIRCNVTASNLWHLWLICAMSYGEPLNKYRPKPSFVTTIIPHVIGCLKVCLWNMSGCSRFVKTWPKPIIVEQNTELNAITAWNAMRNALSHMFAFIIYSHRVAQKCSLKYMSAYIFLWCKVHE